MSNNNNNIHVLDQSNSNKFSSYQISATTTNSNSTAVHTFKIDNNSNYYVEISASGKSITSTGGLFISQKNRIINDNKIVQIYSIDHIVQTSIPNVNISLTKYNNKITINLIGANNNTINWTLIINTIIAN